MSGHAALDGSRPVFGQYSNQKGAGSGGKGGGSGTVGGLRYLFLIRSLKAFDASFLEMIWRRIWMCFFGGGFGAWF